MKMLKKSILLFSKISLSLFLILNIIIACQAYRITYFYEQNEVVFKKFPELSALEKVKMIVFGAKIPKRPMAELPTHTYQTIKLTDIEGYELEGWYVPKPKAIGTILLFHGHAGSKSQLVEEAAFFHDLGYNTLSLDARSHGNSQGNICTIGYKESEGIKLAYDYVKTKGEKNIVLWGTSMGAAMIIKAVSEYDLQPNKLVLNCSFSTMHDAVKGYLRNMKLPQSPLSELLMFWGGVHRGFWTFGYKPSEYIKKINIQTLIQWGAKDVRVTKEETESLLNNINTKDKSLVIYNECGHEPYLEKEPQKWKTSMVNFLKK